MPYQCRLTDVIVLSWNTQDEGIALNNNNNNNNNLGHVRGTLVGIWNWHEQCTKDIHYITKHPAVVFTFAFHLLFQIITLKYFLLSHPLDHNFYVNFEMRTFILAYSRTWTNVPKNLEKKVKILGARKVTWGEMLRTPMRRHPTKFNRPEFCALLVHSVKNTVVAFHPKQYSTSFRRLWFLSFPDTLVGSAVTRNKTLATRWINLACCSVQHCIRCQQRVGVNWLRRWCEPNVG